jgi:hypothetical protein
MRTRKVPAPGQRGTFHRHEHLSYVDGIQPFRRKYRDLISVEMGVLMVLSKTSWRGCRTGWLVTEKSQALIYSSLRKVKCASKCRF